MWAAIAAIVMPLRADLTGNADASRSLDRLIAREAEALLERETERIQRRLNKVNLVLAILLLIVTAGALYGAYLWIAAGWGTLWLILSIPLSVVGGLFLLALTLTCFTMLFTPPKKSGT